MEPAYLDTTPVTSISIIELEIPIAEKSPETSGTTLNIYLNPFPSIRK